jgi:hypothetical protein
VGLLLIFFGLLVTGVVGDYVVENDLLTMPNQTIVLFGTRMTVSGSAVVVGAFLAGMLALLLVVIGIGLLRGSWGRRRSLQRRIAQLEWENTELRSRERLEEIVQAEHARHVVELPASEEIHPASDEVELPS